MLAFGDTAHQAKASIPHGEYENWWKQHLDRSSSWVSNHRRLFEERAYVQDALPWARETGHKWADVRSVELLLKVIAAFKKAKDPLADDNETAPSRPRRPRSGRPTGTAIEGSEGGARRLARSDPSGAQSASRCGLQQATPRRRRRSPRSRRLVIRGCAIFSPSIKLPAGGNFQHALHPRRRTRMEYLRKLPPSQQSALTSSFRRDAGLPLTVAAEFLILMSYCSATRSQTWLSFTIRSRQRRRPDRQGRPAWRSLARLVRQHRRYLPT